MRGYRDLVVWQKAMELVTEIYKVTSEFPRHELYGLTNQIRRAAVSVPSNLAEGHGRTSRREFHQFISQARGSLVELETQLEIAKNLGYLPPPIASELLAKAGRVGRMLNGVENVVGISTGLQTDSRLLTPDYPASGTCLRQYC